MITETAAVGRYICTVGVAENGSLTVGWSPIVPPMSERQELYAEYIEVRDRALRRWAERSGRSALIVGGIRAATIRPTSVN